MKTHFSPRPVATASALALILAACGGGGGGDSVAVTSPPPTGGGGGIGGSGQSTTSSGTIDGFGSIFVNGVRFDTDDSEVIIDGEIRSEDDLRLGMVVLVSGEVDDNGVNGTAERVLYDNELKGPISAIVISADGTSKLLTILGINVIVESTGTVFDDVTFDTLAVDDVVEVSGFTGRGDSLRATRVERESRFVAGQSQIQVRGQAGVVTASEFMLGDLRVDFSSADLVDFPDGTIVEGQPVKVRGTLNDTLITATRIEFDEGTSSRFEQGDTVRVQGAITRFVSAGSFRVGGVDVDAREAVLSPAGLNLGNGAVVQVEGTWSGNNLVASRIESRRGRIKIEAPVGAINIDADTVTLQLEPGSITVQLDTRTRLDDDTGQDDNLRLSDIAPGDFLEVEAYLDGDTLVATTIDREDDDDDHVLQGPVQSFNAGMDITILGLTYSTSAGVTEFEDRDDDDISSELFYSTVEEGDLVKIKDEEIADGIADEVEFEDRDALEGEREFACFGDDDSQDDDSVDDSSDGCDDFSDDSEEDDLTDDDDDLTDDDDLVDDDDDLTDDDDDLTEEDDV